MQPLGPLVQLLYIWSCLGNVEDLWRDFFPKNYTAEPPLNEGSLEISVALTIVSITTIEEEKMEFYADLKVALNWCDYRLASAIVHDTDKTDGNDEDDEFALIPPEISKKLWRPKMFIGGSRQGDRKNLYASVRDGQIRKDEPILSHYFFKPNIEIRTVSNVRTFCPFQFHNYPFDVQHCAIQLHFEMNTPKTVQAVFNESVKPLLLDRSPALQLVINKVTRNYCTVNESFGNALCLELKITFERRIGIHITQTFIPCTMIVVLSWFSFWLDVEAAPARISLGVTALLTLSTSFAHSQTTMPTVAYMKAIDLWMFFCIFSVFMSLVEFTCAYTLNKKSKLKKNKHSIVQKKIVNINGKKYVFPEGTTSTRRNDQKLTLIIRKVKKIQWMSLDDIARIIFPTFFVIFAFTFIMYYWRKMQQGLDE